MNNETKQQAYKDFANALLSNKLELIEEHGNPQGVAMARAAKDKKYECTGELQISAVIAYTSLKIEKMNFDNGDVLKYDGSGWGIGLGATGSTTISGSFSVSPGDLLKMDKVRFQVFFLTGGIGGVEISFWDEDYNPIGIMAGGSLGLGGGSFGGDGKFKKG